MKLFPNPKLDNFEPIIENQNTLELFKYDESDLSSCCTPKKIYQEQNDYDSNFTLLLENSEKLKDKSTEITLIKSKRINLTSLLNIYTVEEHPEVVEIKMTNLCSQSDADYSNLINIKFIIENSGKEEEYSFHFTKVCTGNKNFSIYYKPKFIGYFILSMFFVFEVIFCSYFSAGNDCLSKKASETLTRSDSTLRQIAFYNVKMKEFDIIDKKSVESVINALCVDFTNINFKEKNFIELYNYFLNEKNRILEINQLMISKDFLLINLPDRISKRDITKRISSCVKPITS